MKILIVTSAVPFFPRDGGQWRVYNFVRGIAGDHQVDLIGFFEEGKGPPLNSPLRDLCRRIIPVPRISRKVSIGSLLHALPHLSPYHVISHRSTAMKNGLKHLFQAEKYDIIQTDFLSMAQYREFYPEQSVHILSEHNVETEYWRTYAQYTKGVIQRMLVWLNMLKTQVYERKIIRDFDGVITVSERDRSKLVQKDALSPTRVCCVPIAFDPDTLGRTNIEMSNDPPVITFLGAMNMRMNTDAVIHFTQCIWPKIHEIHPTAKFVIVGQNPPDNILRLNLLSNVMVTGTVPDISPFLQQSQVIVVPLRFGAGVKLKLIQSMAFSKAIVTSPAGALGMEDQAGRCFLLAKNDSEFVAHLDRLLRDSLLRQELGGNAYEYICSNHNIKRTGKIAIRFYSELLERKKRILPESEDGTKSI